jgi:putative transposase
VARGGTGKDAVAKIFNSPCEGEGQGVQFTSVAFLDALDTGCVRTSMDGKGRFLDNIFIERLWRSLKYEEVFIKAHGSVIEGRRGIGGWLSFYNDERPHQALGYRTPRAVFVGEADEHVGNASASLRYAHALPTCSSARGQEKEVKCALTEV